MAEAKGGRSLVLDGDHPPLSRRRDRGRKHQSRHQGRRARRAARPVRLRQDHAAARRSAASSARARATSSIGGESVDHLPPNKRSVGIVFQNYALFPHMTVARERRLWPRGARRRRGPRRARASRRCWRWCSSRAMAERYPKAAVGRPAAARGAGARARRAAVDPAARRAVRRARQEPAARHADRDQAHPAAVGHDHADRHARPGGGAVDGRPRRGLQPGPARAVRHARPTSTTGRPTLFVNTFVGAANLLPGKLVSRRRRRRATSRSTSAARSPTRAADRAARRSARRVTVCMRPEQLRIRRQADSASPAWSRWRCRSAPIDRARGPTADGRAVKIAQPRAAGTAPLAAPALRCAWRRFAPTPSPSFRISSATASAQQRSQPHDQSHDATC